MERPWGDSWGGVDSESVFFTQITLNRLKPSPCKKENVQTTARTASQRAYTLVLALLFFQHLHLCPLSVSGQRRTRIHLFVLFFCFSFECHLQACPSTFNYFVYTCLSRLGVCLYIHTALCVLPCVSVCICVCDVCG